MPRLFLVGFVVVAVAPFAIAATTDAFWQPEHSMAPVVTVVYVIVLVALVLGRYRWAWVLLVLLSGAASVGWAFDSHRFKPRAFWYLFSLATLVLLLSAPMRQRVNDARAGRARR